ncbi:MAG: hypothetical protein QGF68_07990 [Nitrospinota bacterium]|nr:hypothetical protein [Nitrospinota bacterium]
MLDDAPGLTLRAPAHLQEIRHARQILFQLAELAVSRKTFALILDRINRLRSAPA